MVTDCATEWLSNCRNLQLKTLNYLKVISEARSNIPIILQLSTQTLPRGDWQGEVLGPMCHNHQQAQRTHAEDQRRAQLLHRDLHWAEECRGPHRVPNIERKVPAWRRVLATRKYLLKSHSTVQYSTVQYRLTVQFSSDKALNFEQFPKIIIWVVVPAGSFKQNILGGTRKKIGNQTNTGQSTAREFPHFSLDFPFTLRTFLES